MNKNICKFTSLSFSDTLSVSCFVLEADPSIMQKPTTLSVHRMMLILSGKGTLHCENTDIDFESGALLFTFKGETVYITPEPGTSYMYISFVGTRADTLFNRFNVNVKNRYFSGYDGLIPLWNESLSRASEDNIDLASESILLYSFSRLSVSKAHYSELVSKIVSISEARFTEHDLSITTLAKELAYNPKYLSHAFKSELGVRYSEYLSTLRIKYAVSLFDIGLDSIKNVAILSGFTDPLYFSTVFKKLIGVSPAAYIQK